MHIISTMAYLSSVDFKLFMCQLSLLIVLRALQSNRVKKLVTTRFDYWLETAERGKD